MSAATLSTTVTSPAPMTTTNNAKPTDTGCGFVSFRSPIVAKSSLVQQAEKILRDKEAAIAAAVEAEIAKLTHISPENMAVFVEKCIRYGADIEKLLSKQEQTAATTAETAHPVTTEGPLLLKGVAGDLRAVVNLFDTVASDVPAVAEELKEINTKLQATIVLLDANAMAFAVFGLASASTADAGATSNVEKKIEDVISELQAGLSVASKSGLLNSFVANEIKASLTSAMSLASHADAKNALQTMLQVAAAAAKNTTALKAMV
ncbi:MAG TPA: hypothetical protein VLG38_02385 [Gammaproteobacteria bacterium]|nr:hypothetical protein [Gammaproteobacteria bacterium]